MNTHRWNFFKAGGVWQAQILTGSDIANIGSLDEKLWSALSCPVDTLVFDAKTLAFLDSDGDGKIRRSEMVSACEWTCAALKNPDTLIHTPQTLSLANIAEDSAEGKNILLGAKRVLVSLGKKDATEISAADFSDENKIFASTAFNADGVITAASCGDDASLAETLAEIVKSTGGKVDRSGAVGADSGQIKTFFEQARTFVDWSKAGTDSAAARPLGEDTPAAFEAFRAVAEKIDDWFGRVELLAYDPSAAALVNPNPEKISAAFALEGTAQTEALAALPLAEVTAESGELAFDADVNPAWKSTYGKFIEIAAKPFADGVNVLSLPLWRKIKTAFAPHASWLAAKPVCAAEALGVARLESLSSGDAEEKLVALAEKDMAAKPEVDAISLAEKLVHFHRDLKNLLENFVNFSAFYREESSAAFQFGKLYIDRRLCKMCVKISDPARFAAASALGYGFMLVCSCKRKGCADISIAALVSAGESDDLIAGRNGIFIDPKGDEWDATVTKVVSNPIGVGQAFWSPYKRCVRWASEQIAKRASAADSAAVEGLTSGDAAKSAKKIDIGTLAALGVAVGGITTAFGLILEAFFGLGYWMPLGILGIFLAISLPSVLIAWMKLRMRNLAPVLDANGWAINNSVKISMLFGSKLTDMAKLPPDSKRTRLRSDERRGGGLAVALTAAAALAAFGCAIAWHFGLFDSKPADEKNPPANQCDTSTESSKTDLQKK